MSCEAQRRLACLKRRAHQRRAPIRFSPRWVHFWPRSLTPAAHLDGPREPTPPGQSSHGFIEALPGAGVGLVTAP